MPTDRPDTAPQAPRTRAWSAADAARLLDRVGRAGPAARTASQRVSHLASIAAQAAERAQARSYGREAGDLDECLSILRDVPAAIDAVLDDPDDNDDPRGTLDRRVALRIGRALAQGIHVALHRAWRDGQAQALAAPRLKGTLRLLASAERDYGHHLLTSRSACRRRQPGLLQDVFEEVVRGAFATLVPLTRHAAGLSPRDRDAEALGLRIARLGRKTSLLAAAGVLLRARLSSSRTITTTADIASSRRVLSRHEPRLRGTSRTLRGAAAGDRVRMRGRLVEVEWVARPNVPYTRMRLQDTETEVYAHYKNLRRLGLQAGMGIWVAGKVEAVSGADAVIVEFEGPGEHASVCWEDWLATELRPAYDLYPELLFMEWEHPPTRGARISDDLRSRIGRRRPEEV